MNQTPDTTGPAADPQWVSVSELARRLGLAKQSVSERVARYVAAGLLETRDGKNRAKLVDRLAFDRVSSEAADPAKIHGAEVAKGASPQAAPATRADTGYAGHQARDKAAKADLTELARDLEFKRALRVESVEAAMVRCAEALVRRIDQLPSRAADMFAAAQGGEHACRVWLKGLGADLRKILADEMRLLEDEGLKDERARAGEDAGDRGDDEDG